MDRLNQFMNTTMRDTFENGSLLLVRLVCGGGMAFVHGWSKFSHFSSMAETFPDPLHVGSGSLSLALAIFGELVCSTLVAVGFFTRLAAIPPLFTMCVAVFSIHAHDPYEKKELALLYAVGFLVLLMKGGGGFSIDGLLGRKVK